MRKIELQTKLVGSSQLVEVNKHLRYRTDQVEFPSGYRGLYTFIDDDYAAAATVPFDSRRGGRRHVLLVRQERYPSQTVGWEIPAGRPEEGEGALEASMRELLEEGGVSAEYWHQLPQQVEFVGRSNARSDLFVASGITEEKPMPDLEEAITDIGWFSMDKVADMLLTGEINAAHTMGALMVANAFVDGNPQHPVSLYAGLNK